MKIGNQYKNDTENISALNRKKTETDSLKKKSSTGSASEDKVEISSQASELGKLQQQAKASPDIRKDRVEAIKLQLDEGTYRTDSNKIAEKLIDEALFEGG